VSFQLLGRRVSIWVILNSGSANFSGTLRTCDHTHDGGHFWSTFLLQHRYSRFVGLDKASSLRFHAYRAPTV